MKNYIQPGKTITLTAPAAVSSGDVVNVGSIVGIAVASAAKDADVEVQLCGVFTVAKAAEAIAAGDPLYYDATNDNFTKTSDDGLILVGVATKAALLAATTVVARLDGATRVAVPA